MRAAILMWIFCGWLGCPMCFGQRPSWKPSPQSGAKPRIARSSYLELPLRPPDLQSSSQRNLPFGPRRHRFMHFGKRDYLSPFPLHVFTPDPLELEGAEDDLSSVPRTDDDEDSFQVDPDYQDTGPGVSKRGRDDTNRFIHFGKRAVYEFANDGRMKRSAGDVSGGETKRAGNKMMHFGKRLSQDEMFDEDWLNDAQEKRNRIMHFGKRDDDYYKRNPNRIMHFGKRSPILYDKKANKIMHFGKRDPEYVSFESPYDYYVKRSPNRMMHFGKRAEDEVLKRAPNKIMHFGTRMFDDDEDPTKRASPRIMHFGKRTFDDEDPMKRASHRIMHFGKRTFDDDEDAEKRASHRIMHFGKRTLDVEDLMKRASHRIMHFGKRTYDDEDPVKRASDRIMHFGKRTFDDDTSDKRASHKIMHFGKRQDGEATVHRSKRSVDDEATLQRVVSELIGFDKRQPGGILSPSLQLPHAYMAAHVYRSAIPRMLSRPSRSDRIFPALLDTSGPKAQTRNVFLRFG